MKKNDLPFQHNAAKLSIDISMISKSSVESTIKPSDIKQVPQDAAVRAAIRAEALRIASASFTDAPPDRTELEFHGIHLLSSMREGLQYLGFTMVELSNAYWTTRYSATPLNRRLLLLPHCLRDQRVCRGVYDSVGLNCAGCGACDIHSMKRRADELGYQVIIAEGTTSVIMKVLDNEADAILGVACLDSLEKSYERISNLGVPMVAVPLLRDGCKDTEAEIALITQLMELRTEERKRDYLSYVPLLRHTRSLYPNRSLDKYLAPMLNRSSDGVFQSETDRISYEWILEGGKRFRPFITLAAYGVAKHGDIVLEDGADLDSLIPDSVRSISIAIECLHKASLVHDDIEDDDNWRYGEDTLHHRYGVATALNVGDFLIGLGYLLVSKQVDDIGADAVSDILMHLGAAHLNLCRGQGVELANTANDSVSIKPLDVLSIYALKTSQAFEAALYAGMRSAGYHMDKELLSRFCGYLGQGYQIVNDLEDWSESEENKVHMGQDFLSCRPTILRAFAAESGFEVPTPKDVRGGVISILAVRERYESVGAFAKAEALLDRLKSRCLSLADQVELKPIGNLLRFLVNTILARTE